MTIRTVLCCAVMAISMAAEAAMVDPAMDDPNKEWCYLAKSTTVIGVPFVPEPVQITYDGAIYTRNAELCFFYGEKNEPVLATHKTFREGWIPEVNYQWKDGHIAYHVAIFAAIVEPLESDNVVLFARMTMTNEGAKQQTGVFTSAIRGSGLIDRMGGTRWGMAVDTKLAFDADAFRRDGRLVYTFSQGAQRYATCKKAYDKPFNGEEHSLTNRSETGLARYTVNLKPGQSFSADFKMPRTFLSDDKDIEAVRGADFNTFQAKNVAYWKNTIEGRMQFSIPEPRVNNSYKAALVHLILASRGNKGMSNRQGSGLAYDSLFLNDYIDMLLAYDLGGLREFADPNVEWLLAKQHPSGMFIDVHNRGNDSIVTSHGQGLFCLAYHYLITRDDEYAKRVYPAVRKAVQLIIHDHKTNKYGLIRPSIPYDAPMVTGHHTCHNLFALTALQASIRMARLLGEDDDAQAWLAAQKTYKQAILKAMDDNIEKEGHITSGLYDWSAGWVQGHGGWVNDHPNQDWENNLLLFPSEIMSPGDDRVTNTLATIRKQKYHEGVMTYRNGMHIHQYVTLNQANQYLAMGDQQHALSDLYHVLVHNGSTHEGFENLVIPWSRLVRSHCPPPHAWAAAKTALYIRNCMVREFGGEAGLNADERGLYLFSLVSPAWVKPGEKLEIHNAVTEMGTVSATMTFNENGAQVELQPNFHTPPAYLALTVPYFVELTRVDADGKPTEISGDVITFPSDVKKVTLHWKEKPGAHDSTFQDMLKMYRSEYGYIQDRNRFRTEEPPTPVLTDEEKSYGATPMSFSLVRKAFAHEYKRRFEEEISSGGKPIQIQAPAMFVVPPVTASAYIPGHEPPKAMDGNYTDLASSWQTDPYPAWLKIDLEEIKEIGKIQVYPYWGTGRYYQYTVEVSVDGTQWHQVGDMSKNTTPAAPAGDEFRFDPIKAQYIRINMLYHNVNSGVHLVEVRALEK